MRALRVVSIVAMVLAGCNGMTTPAFEEVPPERLPDQLTAWRDAPASAIAVEDAVVGKDTFIRIVVGPCPAGQLKVKEVKAAGPNLVIVTTAPSSGQSEAYSVVYLKTRWEARLQAAPQHVTLQVNSWTGSFSGFEGSGLRRDTLPTQPAVQYKPAYIQKFHCNP